MPLFLHLDYVALENGLTGHVADNESQAIGALRGIQKMVRNCLRAEFEVRTFSSASALAVYAAKAAVQQRTSI